MYVIPTSEFDSKEEEMVKTFRTFEAAEEYCDEHCEEV
jgi:hypothetical protein